jgi:hypothetical protein
MQEQPVKHWSAAILDVAGFSRLAALHEAME